MNINRIRLLIVDDHALFRESIARMLAADERLEVTSVVGTLAEAEDALSVHAVDMVLLDYDLGSQLGLDLLPRLEKSFPSVHVLLVSGGMSRLACKRSAEIGARGLVLKHSSPDHLFRAINAVAGGATWWDSALPDSSDAEMAEKVILTARQRRILDLVLEGMSNKQMSQALSISEASIKASLQEIFKKTGVRTRSQLVRFALEQSAITIAD